LSVGLESKKLLSLLIIAKQILPEDWDEVSRFLLAQKMKTC